MSASKAHGLSARTHLALGSALQRWGWSAGARRAYEDALRADPELVEGHLRLGDALARDRCWEEAASAFRGALRHRSGCTEALGGLSLALARGGRWSEAADALRRLAKRRASDAEVHVLLAAVLARAGRAAEAIATYRWAVRLDAPEAGRQCVLAEEILGARAWAGACEEWAAARALVPASTSLADGRHPWNMHPGPPLRAHPRRRRSWRRWRDDALSAVTAAARGVWAVAGRRSRATAGGALGWLGWTLALAGLPPAPVLAQADAMAVAQARLCARTTGDAGVAACRRALELGLPVARQPAIEAMLAARLSRLERWDEVVEAYRGSVARRPADGQARLRLGAALLHMQDRAAEAEPELREAARLRPEDAEAQALLGNALAMLGRTADAVAAFEQALRRDPAILDGRPASRAAYEAARRGQSWPSSGH